MRTSVWALVLAAGRGRRFGGGKLLAPLAGRPLLAHVLDTARAAVAAELLGGVVVVAPAGDAELFALADAAGAPVLANDSPDAGVSRSIRLGVAALAELDPPAGAALVLLGDQPRVSLDAVRAVVEAWEAGAGPLVRARYAEQPDVPSHPVLIARDAWWLVDALDGDAGIGALAARRGLAVAFIDLPGRNPDVDTTADLARLKERM